MGKLNVAELFEKYEDDFLKTDDIPPDRRLHRRPDLNAFLLLDRLAPKSPTRDMVCSAGHDEIWLEITPKDIAKTATEDDILDLIRCGVRFDRDTECFCMFV